MTSSSTVSHDLVSTVSHDLVSTVSHDFVKYRKSFVVLKKKKVSEDYNQIIIFGRICFGQFGQKLSIYFSKKMVWIFIYICLR